MELAEPTLPCNSKTLPTPAARPSHAQDVQGFTSGLVTANGSELQGVVSWSFEHQLTPAAQNMFLDCVTVLEGEPYDLAMRVWEAWWPRQAFTAFKRLHQLSLVSLSGGRLRLVVQDVIRSIGRSLLLQSGIEHGPASGFAGSRIWMGSDGKPQGHVQVGLRSHCHALLDSRCCMALSTCRIAALDHPSTRFTMPANVIARKMGYVDTVTAGRCSD